MNGKGERGRWGRKMELSEENSVDGTVCSRDH